MDDIISRQATLDCFHDWIDRYGDVHTPDEMPEYRRIEALPVVDAVSVVRCKDCKHYGWTANRVPEEQTWWCYKHNTETGNNDFCSRGERKDGDHHDD